MVDKTNIEITEEDINVELNSGFVLTHSGRHEEGGPDEIDVEKLNIAGDFDLETNNLLSEGATVIWDNANDWIPQGRLENDSITIDANDGLVGGGSVALGESVDLDIEPADFAGTFLDDDGSDNLEVLIGRGLEGDGAGNIQFDEDTAYTFTSLQTLSAGAEVNGDLTDGSTLIYDSSLSQIEQDALENDSVTINANDGLKSGGTVALGSNIGLDIEPDDFAGLFLSDDGTDNLQVDIGRGLEDDGTGQIQFDEDTGYTFTVAQEFDAGITVTGTVSLDPDTIDATEVDIARGLEDDGTGAIQFDEDVAYTFTADQKVIDDIRNLYGTDDDFSISYNSTSDELEIVDEINNTVKMSFDKSGDVFIPNGDLAVSEDIRDGTQIIWDSTSQEIPDSAMGAIENATLANDSVTIQANDGLKSGGTVALGGTVGLDIEPADFAGTFLTDDGLDNLQVDIGRGLEDDGAGNIRFDEDVAYTFTASQTFDAGATSNANISMEGNTITNLSAPSNPNDASRKAYVDSVAQGLNLKDSVVASPTSNIDLASATDPGLVDGVTLADGDRVLLKEQTDGTENGIYIATTATDPTTWVRSADADADSEVTSGMFTFVEEGTDNGSSSFIVVTEDPITLGTTAIEFAQFSSAGEIEAGDGLNRSGQRIDINFGEGVELNADNIRLDEDFSADWTTVQNFGAGLDTQGDITDGTQVIWDESAQEIPDSAMGTIENATLVNDSVTVNANDGLVGGGAVALGGTIGLDIEPADFAGLFLSDDGTDNLQVDIGRGLENDGTGQIQFDEDTQYTFTSRQSFDAGILIEQLIGNATYATFGDLPDPNVAPKGAQVYVLDEDKLYVNRQNNGWGLPPASWA